MAGNELAVNHDGNMVKAGFKMFLLFIYKYNYPYDF